MRKRLRKASRRFRWCWTAISGSRRLRRRWLSPLRSQRRKLRKS